MSKSAERKNIQQRPESNAARNINSCPLYVFPSVAAVACTDEDRRNSQLCKLLSILKSRVDKTSDLSMNLEQSALSCYEETRPPKDADQQHENGNGFDNEIGVACCTEISMELEENYLSDIDIDAWNLADFPEEGVSVNDSILHLDCLPILFDLETSGLGRDMEICQIAAKYENEEFNTYILPIDGIPRNVTQITGMEVVDGKLYVRGAPVDTLPRKVAVGSFLDFLRRTGKRVVLVGHNAVRFDAPLLLRDLRRHKLLADFFDVVHGFTDTLCLFRKVLPGRRTYRQVALVEEFLGAEAAVGAHDATADVRMLHSLLVKFGLTSQRIVEGSVSIESILGKKRVPKKRASESTGLVAMKGKVSAMMISRMKGAGLTLNCLKNTFLQLGEEGIKSCFGETVNGKPRVTKSKMVVNSVVDFLKIYLRTDA